MPPSPHRTLMLPPLALPLGGREAGVGRMEQLPAHLLELLPIPVCRFDLESPAPADIGPEALQDELRERARLGFCNNAAGRLLDPSATGHLAGTRLGALASPLAAPESLLVRRFLAGRWRLAETTVRLTDPDGAVRLYKAHWEGVAAGDRLAAIWVVLLPEAATAPAARPSLPAAAAPAAPSMPEIVGSSTGMRRVLEKIAQVAPTDSTVLIRGETGTGKELIARAIHRRSARQDRPLVAVNCGAIARGVVESELFGHEKGAFTGALNRKIGYVELADGGTLFLDEIGDLPLELQVKLLRVLQEGEVVRVGASQPVRVNVRVIAATHRDLSVMVQRGEFRQDLYYRLNVFPVQLPALRERVEDLPDLARHFMALYAERLGKPVDSIPAAVLERLCRFPWPGNIRELANVIERSVILSPGRNLMLAEWATGATTPVAPAPAAALPALPSGSELQAVEREHILRTLEATGWKVSGPGGAAERLGLKATTLEARMKRLGISRPGRG